MAQDREIKYVNRGFNDFRSQLIEYTKNYFPNTYNDFSPTSPGMMFIEMASYVGDILSFYQDSQLQETFLTHAKDPKNLYSLAYMMGYKPKTTGVSSTKLQITQIIQANSSSPYLPKWNQAAIIPQNSTITSTDSSQTKFLIDSRVDFQFSSSYDPTEATIHSLSGGNPSEYKLVKNVDVFSSEIVTTTFTIDSVEQFKTLTIQDSNIVGVLDIVDASSNEWTEVDYLGQDTIFVSGSSSSDLAIQKVPRRFVSRFTSNGNLQIQFGAGTNDSDDSIILPDPTTIRSSNVRDKFNKAYDPSNFLHTKSYGVAPNSNLTVRYLKGGGVSSNIPADTLNTISFNVLANGDTSRTTSAYLTFTNPKAAEGGRDGDSVEELRENSLRAFNEQSRTVTLNDYAVRALSLPPQFGSVAKALVIQEQIVNSNINPNTVQGYNPFALGLYVLAYDKDKKLITASSQLKNNLKTYLSEHIMVSDSVNIKDAFIINIGIEYDIILRPNYSGRDVINQCNVALRDFFNIDKRSINQSINIAGIYTLLDKVKGVQTVQNLKITNKQDSTGVTYSAYAYDIEGATKNNTVYPSYDPCIFEVKYPNQDIKGRVTII
jgi:hypothetical protein